MLATAGQLVRIGQAEQYGEIAKQLDAAGFGTTVIRKSAKTVHAPSAADFLWGYLHSTPLGDIVAQASDERRARLERDVVKASEGFVNSQGLSFEQGVIVATAAK